MQCERGFFGHAKGPSRTYSSLAQADFGLGPAVVEESTLAHPQAQISKATTTNVSAELLFLKLATGDFPHADGFLT